MFFGTDLGFNKGNHATSKNWKVQLTKYYKKMATTKQIKMLIYRHRIRFTLLLIIGLAILLLIALSPFIPFVDIFLWIRSIGLWGNLIFVLAYLPVSFPFVIGFSLLGVAAGFLYSLQLGFCTALVGCLIGSHLSFWLCRHLLKSWLSDILQRSQPTLATIVNTITAEYGFVFVIMIRLAPIPFGVQNGIFATSELPWPIFSVATLIGVIPKVLLLTYIGSTMHDITSVVTGAHSFGTGQKVMLGIQILVLILLFVFLYFVSRKVMQTLREAQNKLQEETQEEDLENEGNASSV
eukprot:TRINITY_DN23468_c0_g1_i1.p1 TRINITY_DN23468_c0_g1~~TRINITY_DN23468_c0_g1_i1.p1  ORF type:complete len:294 (-),score=22.94 TRINITY_DN23468_c0_g1_i1:98-979(-)